MIKALNFIVRKFVALTLSVIVAAPGLSFCFEKSEQQERLGVTIMSFNVYVAGVGSSSPAYACMTDGGYSDTRAAAAVSDTSGTYNEFKYEASTATIDYVFVRGFKASKFEVVDELCSNGKYASDHFALYADLGFGGDEF